MNEFDRFVASFPPAAPLLPLFHVCDAVGFKSILKDLELRTFPCSVFSMELVYFFYGRPSYRIKGQGMPSSAAVYHPVCFILDFEKTGLPHHIFPFDSGAQYHGLFNDFLHPSWVNRSFQMQPSIDTPGKLVKCFYGNNENYVHEAAVRREFSPLDLELGSYQDLISNKGTTKYDNRRSTVEVAYDCNISITPDNLISIVLPMNFMADPRVMDFVTRMKINVETYSTSHVNPSEYHSSIKVRVDDFLRKSNYFLP